VQSFRTPPKASRDSVSLDGRWAPQLNASWEFMLHG
jgi:hypothetical protein